MWNNKLVSVCDIWHVCDYLNIILLIRCSLYAHNEAKRCDSSGWVVWLVLIGIQSEKRSDLRRNEWSSLCSTCCSICTRVRHTRIQSQLSKSDRTRWFPWHPVPSVSAHRTHLLPKTSTKYTTLHEPICSGTLSVW